MSKDTKHVTDDIGKGCTYPFLMIRPFHYFDQWNGWKNMSWRFVKLFSKIQN